jgi:hypothetical protein
MEIKHSGKSMEQRIADRLKTSGDVAHSDVHAVHGTGPTRAHTHIHHTPVQQYGDDHPGEPGIDGKMRGPANPKGQIP